jgi:hypothetical protein
MFHSWRHQVKAIRATIGFSDLLAKLLVRRFEELLALSDQISIHQLGCGKGFEGGVIDPLGITLQDGSTQ